MILWKLIPRSRVYLLWHLYLTMKLDLAYQFTNVKRTIMALKWFQAEISCLLLLLKNSILIFKTARVQKECSNTCLNWGLSKLNTKTRLKSKVFSLAALLIGILGTRLSRNPKRNIWKKSPTVIKWWVTLTNKRKIWLFFMTRNHLFVLKDLFLFWNDSLYNRPCEVVLKCWYLILEAIYRSPFC